MSPSNPGLWFDVEKRYNTTFAPTCPPLNQLWFDVEKRYNTTCLNMSCSNCVLWFDVEKRYNTTAVDRHVRDYSCGLM